MTRRRRTKKPTLTPEQIAARDLHLSDCPHGPEHLIENERGRMERCSCWKRAQQAIALPPAREFAESEV